MPKKNKVFVLFSSLFIFWITIPQLLYGLKLDHQKFTKDEMQQYLDDHHIHSVEVTSSPRCGRIVVVDGQSDTVGFNEDEDHSFSSFAGIRTLKYKRQLYAKKKFQFWKQLPQENYSFQTKEGVIVVKYEDLAGFSKKSELSNLDDKEKKKLKKDVTRWLTLSLRNQMQLRVMEAFRAETGPYKALGWKKFDKSVEQVTELLNNKKPKNLRNQIRLYKAIYPEVINNMTNNEDDRLRPFYCHFEKKEHDFKMAKKWSQLMLIPALGFGITAITVGSVGLVLPWLAICAGLPAVIIGLRDISLGVADIWRTEKAASIANKIKLIKKQAKKSMKSLQKKKANKKPLSVDEENLLKMLEDLDKNKKQRDKILNKAARSSHMNRLLIAFGFLNAGFNGVNLTGDPTLLAKLPGIIFGWFGA